MTPSQPILEALSLCKSFGGVEALKDVSLAIDSGEIVAVIGENGAGKSTLMKVLCGVYQADSGRLLWMGREHKFHDTQEAMKSGIARIPQELELCESMTVEENLLLGREPTGRWGVLDKGLVRSMAERSIDRLNLKISLDDPVRLLGHGQRQLLSIARSLDAEAKVLLLDEPTATLSPSETDRLLQNLKELRAAGRSMVLITHRLAEVETIADRVIVLRDGKHVATLTGDEIQRQAMVRHMVGREIKPAFQVSRSFGEPVLTLKTLSTEDHPDPISLQIHQGECVALAGLVGSGRSELLEAVFGLRNRHGTVIVGEKELLQGNPVEAVKAGLCLVPEERSEQGLSLNQSVEDNAALPSLHQSAGFAGYLRATYSAEIAKRVVSDFNVIPDQIETAIRDLSGGNQQKVVMGKWMELDPSVLLLDEPTRGVDVGAREEIHQRLRGCLENGQAIFFASSELEEVFAISDKIVVLAEGKVMGILKTLEATEEAVMELATKAGSS